MLHTVGPTLLGGDGAGIEELPIVIVQGDFRWLSYSVTVRLPPARGR